MCLSYKVREMSEHAESWDIVRKAAAELYMKNHHRFESLAPQYPIRPVKNIFQNHEAGYGYVEYKTVSFLPIRDKWVVCALGTVGGDSSVVDKYAGDFFAVSLTEVVLALGHKKSEEQRAAMQECKRGLIDMISSGEDFVHQMESKSVERLIGQHIPDLIQSISYWNRSLVVATNDNLIVTPDKIVPHGYKWQVKEGMRASYGSLFRQTFDLATLSTDPDEYRQRRKGQGEDQTPIMYRHDAHLKLATAIEAVLSRRFIIAENLKKNST